MKKRWTKKEILTIPNGMSVFRILLIPLFLWLYVEKGLHYGGLSVLVLSALSDIFDGIIARKFDMVSDFGKILDPIADKLTQGSLILALTLRYPEIWFLFVIFAVKELTVGIVGLISLKKTDTVGSAQWFGKLTTVIFESCMAFLLLCPTIPPKIADGIFAFCAATLLFSLIMYLLYFLRLIREQS